MLSAIFGGRAKKLDFHARRDALVEAFQDKVLPCVAFNQAFSSEVPEERRAFAVHWELLQTNSRYKEIVDRMKNLAQPFDNSGLSERLEAMSEQDNSLRKDVRAIAMILSHMPILLRASIIQWQLTRMALPFLEKSLER